MTYGAQGGESFLAEGGTCFGSRMLTLVPRNLGDQAPGFLHLRLNGANEHCGLVAMAFDSEIGQASENLDDEPTVPDAGTELKRLMISLRCPTTISKTVGQGSELHEGFDCTDRVPKHAEESERFTGTRRRGLPVAKTEVHLTQYHQSPSRVRQRAKFMQEREQALHDWSGMLPATLRLSDIAEDMQSERGKPTIADRFYYLKTGLGRLFSLRILPLRPQKQAQSGESATAVERGLGARVGQCPLQPLAALLQVSS
jgi:hypothetical protein